MRFGFPLGRSCGILITDQPERKGENMDGVNKTLYIPLYGKAYVSEKGLFLKDKKAEEIWAAEGFPLKGKSKSKWLAYCMGIRAAVFDDWVRQQARQAPEAVVVHLGCGLDSRVLRVGAVCRKWYDVDFPQVIRERKRYYPETPDCKMVSGDLRDPDWLDEIPEGKRAIVVMEGVSMYLTPTELKQLTENLSRHFESYSLLMDCYTGLAAKMSRYKNPINDVGVTKVYGMDDPAALQTGEISFVQEHPMTPEQYIHQLKGAEKLIFRKLYAGSFSRGLYRLFEYRKN